jgi:hypothetical protein
MKNKKDKIKINTFNVILEKCHTKIKTIAEQGGMNLFYEIPYFLLGYPLYQINDCVEYVVESLRTTGFLVQTLPKPNNYTVYISWKPTDVKQKKRLVSSRFH